jgi:hypothetical protein
VPEGRARPTAGITINMRSSLIREAKPVGNGFVDRVHPGFGVIPLWMKD